MRRIFCDLGRGLYNLFVAIAVVAFLGGTLAIANYAVTVGSGTNFGSVVIGGTVHYAQQLLCDVTTPSQCAAVSNTGAVSVNVANASTDPCINTKTNFAWGNSSGTTQLVAPSGSTQVYVCSFSLIAGTAAVINLVGGTGATCTTGTPVAAIGSTTPASGMSLAANGGLTYGSGIGTVARTTTAGHGLCLIQSGTSALAGNITFVQQ